MCIENIPCFINQWGTKLQPLPEYEIYFENSLIGNLWYFIYIFKIQSFFLPNSSFTFFRYSSSTYLGNLPAVISATSSIPRLDRKNKINTQNMEYFCETH